MNRNLLSQILIFSLFWLFAISIIDIRDFGALHHQDHISAQFANQKAISLAVNAANNLATA